MVADMRECSFKVNILNKENTSKQMKENKRHISAKITSREKAKSIMNVDRFIQETSNKANTTEMVNYSSLMVGDMRESSKKVNIKDKASSSLQPEADMMKRS